MVSKGGTTQVRFQPRLGHLLAAAANNMVAIFDVETDRQTHLLKVHNLILYVSFCLDYHFVAWTSGEDCYYHFLVPHAGIEELTFESRVLFFLVTSIPVTYHPKLI